jgi:hypothetical protein
MVDPNIIPCNTLGHESITTNHIRAKAQWPLFSLSFVCIMLVFIKTTTNLIIAKLFNNCHSSAFNDTQQEA